MTVLSDAERRLIWIKHMANAGKLTNEPFGNLVKDDILAAVDALDDWLDTNASVINLAIPLPARTELTTAQKALMLQYVVESRYLSGA